MEEANEPWNVLLDPKEVDHCFEGCDCHCEDSPSDFDKTILEETRFGITLRDITHNNVCWYTDKSMDDSGLKGLRFSDPEGIYILWHKNDYCPVHELFHMRALYVGKGNAKRRLVNHWAKKNTSEEMLIYFSFFPCRNRIAKYIEQLFLDTYNIPLNKSENTGKHTLCAYFTQEEVD